MRVSSVPYMPGMFVGDSTELSSELRTAMEAKLQQYIQLLLQNKPPVASRTPLTGDSFSSSRVFDGAAGYSLIFLKLAKQTSNETYLTLSDQYLQQAIDLLPEQEMMVCRLVQHFCNSAKEK